MADNGKMQVIDSNDRPIIPADAVWRIDAMTPDGQDASVLITGKQIIRATCAPVLAEIKAYAKQRVDAAKAERKAKQLEAGRTENDSKLTAVKK
jgi:hypothetical protein